MGDGLRTRMGHEDEPGWRTDARPARRRTFDLCHRHLRRGAGGHRLRSRYPRTHRQTGPRRGPQDARLAMPAKWTKRIIGAAALAAIAGGLAWFAWPRPVLVDLATVSK